MRSSHAHDPFPGGDALVDRGFSDDVGAMDVDRVGQVGVLVTFRVAIVPAFGLRAERDYGAVKNTRLLTNSSIPSGPSSLPKPDLLVPPNGISAPSPAMVFTLAIPTSS